MKFKDLSCCYLLWQVSNTKTRHLCVSASSDRSSGLLSAGAVIEFSWLLVLVACNFIRILMLVMFRTLVGEAGTH